MNCSKCNDRGYVQFGPGPKLKCEDCKGTFVDTAPDKTVKVVIVGDKIVSTIEQDGRATIAFSLGFPTEWFAWLSSVVPKQFKDQFPAPGQRVLLVHQHGGTRWRVVESPVWEPSTEWWIPLPPNPGAP